MKKKSEPCIPPCKVSCKAMNLIAEIAAAETDKKTTEKTD